MLASYSCLLLSTSSNFVHTCIHIPSSTRTRMYLAVCRYLVVYMMLLVVVPSGIARHTDVRRPCAGRCRSWQAWRWKWRWCCFRPLFRREGQRRGVCVCGRGGCCRSKRLVFCRRGAIPVRVSKLLVPRQQSYRPARTTYGLVPLFVVDTRAPGCDTLLCVV